MTGYCTPLKLYIDTKNDGPWKMHLLSNMAILGIYVSLQGCKVSYFFKQHSPFCFEALGWVSLVSNLVSTQSFGGDGSLVRHDFFSGDGLVNECSSTKPKVNRWVQNHEKNGAKPLPIPEGSSTNP